MNSGGDVPPVRREGARAWPVIVLVLGALLVWPAGGHADDDDQERALRALKAGAVLPLRVVLDEVENRFDGDVLEVELDDDKKHGRHFWAYEIKLISREGHVIKIKIDAQTKEILSVKGRGASRAWKKQAGKK